MTPEHKETLRGMGKTSYGKALTALLDEELKKITNLQTCSSWEETQGRQHAERLIKKIFSFINHEDKTGSQKNPYV